MSKWACPTVCVPGGAGGKECLPMQEMYKTKVQPLSWEDPRRRAWQSTPGFLPGESQGQRSLVGCSPWGLKESDTTEAT